MNENNEIKITEQDINKLAVEISKEEENNSAPNKKFFDETIRSRLSEEEIQKELGGLSDKWKNDRIEPVKTATDQQKIDAYNKLEVQDLPFDWKIQLNRLKHLEKNKSDYLKSEEELKGWTDIFGEKKPTEIQEEIKKLEENKNKIENELKEKVSELEKSLETSILESKQVLFNFGEKVKELEKEIGEWKGFFKEKELEEVKKEWKELEKRPDISITENEFYDDYARRESIQQSELRGKELIKEREKGEELRGKNEELWQTISNYLKNERTRRYALSKPVLTIKQAREEISELLEETEKRLEDYSDGIITDQNYPLDLNLWEKTWIQKILEWIKEARTTLDYEMLFERWNNGKEYNEKNDFDGSLYLLWKWLEVKDFEPKNG